MAVAFDAAVAFDDPTIGFDGDGVVTPPTVTDVYQGWVGRRMRRRVKLKNRLRTRYESHLRVVVNLGRIEGISSSALEYHKHTTGTSRCVSETRCDRTFAKSLTGVSHSWSTAPASEYWTETVIAAPLNKLRRAARAHDRLVKALIDA